MDLRKLVHILLVSLVVANAQGRGCHRPGDIGNGKITTQQQNFVTGNVITYQCDHNYILVGDSQRKCMEDGQWSGSQPYCTGKGCSRPSDITRGKFSPDEDSYVAGNVVTYQCESGYMVIGNKQRTCQDDGRWSGNQPSCAVPGPCHKQHGRQCHQNARCDKDRYKNDYQCVCNDGYQGDGINCHPLDPCRKHHGQGCHQHAHCEKRHHDDYRCVCNDGYQGDGVNNCHGADNCERYLHQKCHKYADCVTISDKIYECRCKPGYAGDGFYCQGKGCSRPTDFPRGGFSPDQESYVTGNVITYQCNDQYQAMGDHQRTCLENGRWSGHQPRCEVAGPCYKLHGRSCHQHGRCERPHGEKDYRCICNSGYQGDGINCHPEDPCRKHHSQRCHHNARCERHHQGYRCICNDGYDGDGVHNCFRPDNCEVYLKRKCHRHADCIRISDKKHKCQCRHGYTGDGFHCEGMGCQKPSNFPSGKFSPDKRSYAAGNVITYSCDEKYKLIGDSQRTCQGNSEWSGNQPRCEVPGPCHRQCHHNARCEKPQNEKKHRCICNHGYDGDGINCYLPDPCRGRDGHGCHQNARCDKPQYEDNYRCICNKGFQGDGVNNCQRLDNCQQYLNQKCHEFADCIGAGDKQYECRCRHGYRGDGFNCQVSKSVRCRRLSDIAHGHANAPPQLLEGSRVKYDCNPGYLLSGNAEVTCLPSGIWSGNAPTCKKEIKDPRRRFCSRPPGIPHGMFMAPPILSVGSKVKYECDPGYSLSGNAERTCEAPGIWSGADPACEKVDDCAKNLKQKCNEYAVCIKVNKKRSRCRCMTGYKGDGIKCQDMSCPGPGGIENGQILPTQGRFPKGSTITYQCNPGFKLVGKKDRRCQGTRRWSGKEPRCVGAKPVYCSRPLKIPHGTVTAPPRLVVGSKVVYGCDTGHTLSGDAKRTCMASGLWSGSAPTCRKRKILCRRPAEIAHGSVAGPPILSEGSKAIYSCNSGYSLSGNAEHTCMTSGIWSGSVPKCEMSDPCYKIQNRRCHQHARCDGHGGRKYRCVCHDSYTGDGYNCNPFQDKACEKCHEYASCITDGITNTRCECWGGYKGDGYYCEASKAAQCPRPSDIAHGKVSKRDEYTVNIRISYTCDPGYILIGNGERSCTASGHWSGSDPRCEKPDPCHRVQNRPCHKHARCDGGHAGRKRQCVCNDGYTGDGYNCHPHRDDVCDKCHMNADCIRITGQKSRCECRHGYKGDGYYCQGTGCHRPGCIAHGTITNSQGPFTEGDKVTYKCYYGYVLKGDPERICQDDGQWSGVEPRCEEKPRVECGYEGQRCHKYAECITRGGSFTCRCKDPYKGDGVNCHVIGCEKPGCVGNGRLLTMQEHFIEGNIISYQCDQGFVMRSNPQRTCMHDGRWSGDEPRCDVPDRCHRRNGWPCHQHAHCERRHGEDDYQCVCNNGYVGDGRNCASEGCNRPETIAHGRLLTSQERYAVGKMVTYKCNGDHLLIGNEKRKCMPDGRWSGNSPQCVL